MRHRWMQQIFSHFSVSVPFGLCKDGMHVIESSVLPCLSRSHSLIVCGDCLFPSRVSADRAACGRNIPIASDHERCGVRTPPTQAMPAQPHPRRYSFPEIWLILRVWVRESGWMLNDISLSFCFLHSFRIVCVCSAYGCAVFGVCASPVSQPIGLCVRRPPTVRTNFLSWIFLCGGNPNDKLRFCENGMLFELCLCAYGWLSHWRFACDYVCG